MVQFSASYSKKVCDDSRDQLICATNGVTYLNLCELYRAKKVDFYIEPEHRGTCLCSAAEKFDWDPICGTDTDSYANYCEYQKAKTYNLNLQIRHRDLCNEFLKREVLSYRELQKLAKWKSFMPKELYDDFIKRPVYPEPGMLMD